MMLLHGEQYLEIRKFPLPTSGVLESRGELVEVVDKGNAAVVRSALTTVDKETGEDVFYSEMVVFVRGSGGFGGVKKGRDRGAATAGNVPPKRAPDVVVESKTEENQAAIYRLSGDYKYVLLFCVFYLASCFPFDFSCFSLSSLSFHPPQIKRLTRRCFKPKQPPPH